MGPLILFCTIAGAAFTILIASTLRESHVVRQAGRFAKVYNQAARAQWERFRAAHPENDCAPPMGRTGFTVRSMLDDAAGTNSFGLWPRSWGKDAEAKVLAKFYDDATHTAHELRRARARAGAKCRGVRVSVTIAAA
jgi:hypothetical protein